MNTRSLDHRINFLIMCLVALVFISKISLATVPGFPREFSFLIFQHGLHPYVNVVLTLLFGLPLLFFWWRSAKLNNLSIFYKVFLFLLGVILATQTFLQIKYVNTDESIFFQMGAMMISIFMLIIYGVIIPSFWGAKKFLNFVQAWSGFLVLMSLLVLPLFSSVVFKGGRFIGIFKHIPHMVTCSTVAFVFTLGTIVQRTKMHDKFFDGLILGASFLCIILTGTRSSAAAALGALGLNVLLHQSISELGKVFKFSVIFFIFSFTLFFGVKTLEYGHAIATGEASIGGRQAQNGVDSRLEEIERGGEIFMEQPWIGHGLVSKFTSGHDVDVSNYNAMKDPHNILVSAGVIGGWPLLGLAAGALLMGLIGSFKSLLLSDSSKRQVAIYLIFHLPILVIYHVHLSVGGMADRIYWMIFGFLASGL